MEEIKEIIWTQKFEQDFKKIKDRAMQDKLVRAPQEPCALERADELRHQQQSAS